MCEQSVCEMNAQMKSEDVQKEMDLAFGARSLNGRRGSISPSMKPPIPPDLEPVKMTKKDNQRVVELRKRGGSSSPLPRRQSSYVGATTMTHLLALTQFSMSDLAKLRTRFHEISRHTTISPEDFRHALGIVGMTSDSIISQRLFTVFDESNSGQLSFANYARGLSIMMKGTIEEKLNLSFQIMDLNKSGSISFHEFNAIIQSTARTYCGIMGESMKKGTLPESEVRVMFDVFEKDPRTGEVTRDLYIKGIMEHPRLLSNFGVNRKRSAELTRLQIERSRLTDHLSRYKQTLAEVMGKMEDFRKKLRGVMDLSEKREEMLKSGKMLDQEMGSWMREILTVTSTRHSTSKHREKTFSTSKKSDDDENNSAGDSEEKEDESKEEEQKATSYFVDFQEKDLGLAILNGRVTRCSGKESDKINIGDEILRVGEIAVGEVGKNLDTRIAKMIGRDSKRPIRITFQRRRSLNSMKFASEEKMTMLRNRLLNKSSGNMVFFGHRDWELVMKLMQGIQLSVNRANQEVERDVTAHDFNVKEKYTLRRKVEHKNIAKSTSMEQSIKDLDLDKLLEGHVRFVDYAPFVFRKLRELVGISDEDYVNSIGPANMLSNLILGSLTSLSQLGSEGKSGSFFYFTSDTRFMVKTISKSEHLLLRSILKDYYKYLETHPDSMLCRILGCHQMRFGKHSKVGAEKMYFIVMQNCFVTDMEMDMRFDLKGSWVGRYAGKALWKKKGACLKDQDMREMGMRINVGDKRRERLIKAIDADSEFLRDHSVIDYSLLLGVHKNEEEDAPTLAANVSQSASHPASHAAPFYQVNGGGMLSLDGKMTYFFGIIDILTLFSQKKRWELRFKRLYQDTSGKGVSVQPPKQYHKRFVAFIRHVTH